MGFGYCKILISRNFSYERRLIYDIILYFRRYNEMFVLLCEKIKCFVVVCVWCGLFILFCFYVFGFVVVLFASSFARDVYVDENVFFVGFMYVMFDDFDGVCVDDYVEILIKIMFDVWLWVWMMCECLEWVLNVFDECGFESYKLWFDGVGDLFNVYGVVCVVWGNGWELMVLVMVLGDGDVDVEVVMVGLALRAFEKIGRVSWLAKDLMWVCVDGLWGEIDGMMVWLKMYYLFSVGDLGGGFECVGVI